MLLHLVLIPTSSPYLFVHPLYFFKGVRIHWKNIFIIKKSFFLSIVWWQSEEVGFSYGVARWNEFIIAKLWFEFLYIYILVFTSLYELVGVNRHLQNGNTTVLYVYIYVYILTFRRLSQYFQLSRVHLLTCPAIQHIYQYESPYMWCIQ